MKTVLTIAGSDSCGGAGIEADIRTITDFNLHPMTAITALTMQNTCKVKKIYPISPEFTSDLLDNLFEDIIPNAVKIGMLYNSEMARAVYEKLKKYDIKNIVLDPLLISGTGTVLTKDTIREVFDDGFFSICTLITPNASEASKLAHMEVKNIDDAKLASRKLSERHQTAVLIKGGHLNDEQALDILSYKGKEYIFSNPRLPNCDPHGTGCILSSAIASNLALGKNIIDSVSISKDYLYSKLKNAKQIGKGKKLI
ncbi:MAG: bifunctional hydroxymethylpyrimidine kinase/phosphomethylpyrimidine kinase [Clostridia bacterium]|nr:bifunctional hydroxymethylpyrimidine kinase/phosphomethylpyrimidine kinase [Clostridia bacterium]